MLGKRLLVFMTDAEAETAKKQQLFDKANDICFVAKTNAYALSKKCKAVNATLDDFRFQYQDRLQDLFLETEVTNIRCIAPHTLEGLYWLSHWHHWREANDSTGMHVSFVTYNVAGSDNWFNTTTDDLESEAKLAYIYNLYVWNQITASCMYTSALKTVAGTLLKSKKSAFSFGMYRCLAALASFPNPRSVTYGITNRDDKGESLGTYFFDPYDAVPLRNTSVTKQAYATDTTCVTTPLKFEKTHSTTDTVVDPASFFQSPAVPGDSRTHLIEAYDPYITCLLANLPLRKYWDLVHFGYLSIACSFNIEDLSVRLPCAYNGHMRKVVAYIDELTRQGILRIGSGKTYATNVLSGTWCTPWHDTMVLACSTEKIMECFDYSVLYDRYQTRTLVRYCEYPMQNTVRLTGYAAKGNIMEVCNTTTAHVPAVDTSTPCDLGWLSVVDSSAVLKTPMQFSEDGWLSLDARAEIINSPLALSNVFNVLESLFGYTPSYVYSVIRSLSRKGCLEITNHGVNLTAYGYAIGAAMSEALNHGSGKEHMAALDAMHVELTENALFNVITVGEKPADILPLLEKAKSLVSEISKQTKLWKGYKVTVKKKKPGSKVPKKYVYRLRFDRKLKHAWFETRKHKKSFIHAKVLEVTQSISFGASRVTHSLYETKLVPGSVGFLKSQVLESPCPECGTMAYTYKRSPDKTRLLLKCNGCRGTRPAVFQIIDTTINDPLQNL